MIHDQSPINEISVNTDKCPGCEYPLKEDQGVCDTCKNWDRILTQVFGPIYVDGTDV